MTIPSMWILAVSLFLSFDSVAQDPSFGAPNPIPPSPDCMLRIQEVSGKGSIQTRGICAAFDPHDATKMNDFLAAFPEAQRPLQKMLDTVDPRLPDRMATLGGWVEQYRALSDRLQAQSAEDELKRQALASLRKGDLAGVEHHLTDLLERKQGSRKPDQLAADEFNLGQAYDLDLQPARAFPYYERAYKSQPKNLALALSYASSLGAQKRLTEAIAPMETSATLLRGMTGRSPADNDALAQIVQRMGDTYLTLKRLKESQAPYEEAAGIYRELMKEQPAYRRNLAEVLNSLGYVYHEVGRTREAEAALAEALPIYREMAKANPIIYQPEVALIAHNLGQNYGDDHRAKDAIGLYEEAGQIYRELAKTNASFYLPYLAYALKEKAGIYEAAQSPREAAFAYKEASDILRQQATDKPAAFKPALAEVLFKLANLYHSMQQIKDCSAALEESAFIQRQLAKSDPSVYRPNLFVNTLDNLGAVYLESGQMNEARAAFQEALQVCRELAKTNPAYRPAVDLIANHLALAEGKTK